MGMPLIDLVILAYLAAALCVLGIELYPRGRLVLHAATSSIVFALAGGVLWTYIAFFQPSSMPALLAASSAGAGDGGRHHLVLFESETAQASVQPGTTASAQGGTARHPVAPAGGAAAGGGVDYLMVQQPAGKSADTSGTEPDITADCEACPPLIDVPAGSVLIGAAESEPAATAAERPQTQVRYWPGFKISVEPVSAASFESFLSETGRARPACGAQTAALDAPSAPPVVSSGLAPPAACVTPADADAYAGWLTARTGKHFRLPTAAEWEYAARVVPAPSLSTGTVAEIVADCWHGQIPQQGKERLAAQTAHDFCDGRMLKGAAAAEAARWHRFSSRRRLGPDIAASNVGFRVVRTENGFN